MPKALHPAALALAGAFALAAALAGPAAAGPAEDADLRASVVKVFVEFKPADFRQPWQLANQASGSGSGFILEGHRILTNAHVVSDQIHLQVMKAGDTHKATAHVRHVAHDSDLAELSVDEPGFFDGTVPVRFGGMPRQRERVAAYGFPIGGEELSVTEGVVSRIEVTPYAHGGRKLLMVQTDAAINPGNSGGPVFKDGRFVGVSTQHIAGANNACFFIPSVLVERFLKDVADGSYDGIPGLGLNLGFLESPALRSYLGLKAPRGGVVVNRVLPGSSADGLLKEGDVLLKLDGVAVAENGTVPLEEGARVHLSHLVSLRQAGERARLDLWRDGAPASLTLTLKATPELVPGLQYDVRPSYFVYAGLVFQVLNDSYLWQLGPGASSLLRYYSDWGQAGPRRREIVVLSMVLPHDVNVGYHQLGQAPVVAVNGRPVAELADVVRAVGEPVKTARGSFLTVSLDRGACEGPGSVDEVVLDAAAAARAQPAILKAFGIPAEMSPDLAPAASGKAGP